MDLLLMLTHSQTDIQQKNTPIRHVPGGKTRKKRLFQDTPAKYTTEANPLRPEKGNALLFRTLGRNYSTNFIKVSDFVKECLKYGATGGNCPFARSSVRTPE